MQGLPELRIMEDVPFAQEQYSRVFSGFIPEFTFELKIGELCAIFHKGGAANMAEEWLQGQIAWSKSLEKNG